MVRQPSQSVSSRFNALGIQTYTQAHTHEIKGNKSLETKSEMKAQMGNNHMPCKRAYCKEDLVASELQLSELQPKRI